MINMKRTDKKLKKIILTLSLVFIITLAGGYTMKANAEDPAPPAGGEAAAPAAEGTGDTKAAKDNKGTKDAGEAPAAGAGDAGAPAAGDEKKEGGGEKTETAAAPAADEPEAPIKEYTPRDKSKDPKDPFKPLIAPPPPVQPQQQQPQQNKPEPVKEVPPLPIKVTFIVGSDAKKIAVMSLNNKTYEMGAGEQEDAGLFKVLEVTDNNVKIFDSRVQKERTIPLQTN